MTDTGLEGAAPGVLASDTGGTAPSEAAAAPEGVLASGELWAIELPGCGVSSPRTLHVDDDGVLDVVLGVGKEGFWGAMVALSGADGRELWRAEVSDEVYATPCLVLLDGDDVPDVVFGRRRLFGGLQAVSGATGERIWGIHGSNPDIEFPELHFNTAVPLPDVDGDGVAEVLALQGGGDDQARQPSRMWVLSGATGVVLRERVTPEGEESFFVPCIDVGPGGPRALVGTGGETLPGHLYAMSLPDLEVSWSFPSEKKGFVAGGLLHDFDGDGVTDPLVTGFNGTTWRLDGRDGSVVWKLPHRRTESYVTPTVGRFDDRDDVLDVVAGYSEGKWPYYRKRTWLQWIDGATGEVLAEHDRGVQTSSSPIVADLDGDGFDEVLLVNNLTFDMDRKSVACQLDVFGGGPGKPLLMTRRFQGYSAATPWLGDLDDDGVLDLVFVNLNGVHRIALGEAPVERVHWGEYRGPDQLGVVPRR